MNNSIEANRDEQKFLNKHVFYGLTNLNDGFDAPSIKYFSEADFRLVLERVKELGIGIMGIEPWLDGEYYDVSVCEEYNAKPTEPEWYFKAFEEFKKRGLRLQYAATYWIGG